MDEPIFKSDMAKLVYKKISILNYTKTDDSDFTKFLNPQFIAISHRYAAAFTAMVFAPQIEPNETINTRIYTLYSFLIIYGINIYICEMSIKTQGLPYKIKTGVVEIENAQAVAFKKLTEENKTSEAFKEVGEHILNTLGAEITHKLDYGQYKVQIKKAKKYLDFCLLYGYILAQEITVGEKEN